MPVIVVTDPVVWWGGYALARDLAKISIKTSVDDVDVTRFGAGGARERIGGLADVEVTGEGLWQAGAGAVDAEVWATLGQSDRVVTIASAATEGTVAYLTRLTHTSLEILGAVGEAAPMTVEGQGSSGAGVARGQIVRALGTVSATGVLGSARQVGAVPVGRAVHAALHVMSVGTSVTVQVQSDDNSGFTSPTTVGTIGPITAVGATLLRVAGPITDDWWRFNVSAITGTHTVAGAIGIGA